MPFLNVKISPAQPAETTQRIASFLTEHTASLLGKKKELISVAIDYVPPDHWAIGGAPLSQTGDSTFYLEIKITEGTNLKREKAEYIQKVYAEFEAALGELNPASYIVVQDLGADSWGYGGATQEFRFIAGRSL